MEDGVSVNKQQALLSLIEQLLDKSLHFTDLLDRYHENFKVFKQSFMDWHDQVEQEEEENAVEVEEFVAVSTDVDAQGISLPLVLRNPKPKLISQFSEDQALRPLPDREIIKYETRGDVHRDGDYRRDFPVRIFDPGIHTLSQNCRGVVLEDEVMLLGTSDDVLREKGKEKAPVMELAKKSNLVSEIAKQPGEIQKFPIQEEAMASDVAKLKEAEDGYTTSTVMDSHKLRMNPHSVLPPSGSSVFSFNAFMVPNLFRPRRASFIHQMSRLKPSARLVAVSSMLTTQKLKTSTELTGLHLAYLEKMLQTSTPSSLLEGLNLARLWSKVKIAEEMSLRHLNRLQRLLSMTNEYSSRNILCNKWHEYQEPILFLDDAVERGCFVYHSYIALGSYQLFINEIDDYIATPLQLVKLLALYLSSPDNKELTISSLKEWLADSAIRNNSILRLIGGIIFMHEQDYNEALKHNYLIFIFSSCRNLSA